MLKAKAILPNGVDLILLGLSDMNLEKLRAGEPIHVNDPDFPQIVIMHGKTEDDIAESLKGMITSDTTIHNETE